MNKWVIGVRHPAAGLLLLNLCFKMSSEKWRIYVVSYFSISIIIIYGSEILLQALNTDWLSSYCAQCRGLDITHNHIIIHRFQQILRRERCGSWILQSLDQ